MHRWISGRRMVVALALAGAFAAAGGLAIGKDTARTPEKRAEAAMEAKIDRAQAAYATARKKCGDAKTDARKACVHKARVDRDAAIRLAKIEKVRELNALKEKEEERRTGQAEKPLSDAGKFAAAKARCEMMGPDRDRCLAEAKQRFHKT
ncbi:hypothetical protein [Ramlibacter albus]|uniref:Uncharacterized protein n=1 Tax=Ramlibacter albus TaxID=2079448 RepID=A0A923M818_9BURK|nr:hypothetical protein [Ramlibacter albus]MBC5765705.1 hypothetical protein [Ramlibacter albus]